MSRKGLGSRIRDYIVENIDNGKWKPGDIVPGEFELMKLFSASRMTVHRAIKELATEGLVYRERGRGTFVAKRIPRSDLLVVADIAEEIRGRGADYYSDLKYLAAEPQSPLTAHVFGEGAANSLARSKVVHCENGVPVQLEDRYVDVRLAPKYLTLDFTQTTAHKYLMKAAPLMKAEHELTAVLPNSEQQYFLNIPENEPCLLLRRKTWTGERLVSYAELYYPASRYTFGGTFTPGGGANDI
ncbi:histidine utilization repressor [Salidesulfovibrio brasiliensis]|uniref:histidine utilization repressor n=1 Tax=Salidesulfovibrio brasiliensis TaxID=221711 RepID=UPI0009FAF8A9|nr:histidine utilization repressor [Salidesulfovibrio brasiliensis]